ncbi:two-component system response regulator [Rhodopirellula maiorica SM1]|uniref:Two-component system response regulator n=1 Tax=Rhodopirellula maiorica SM1 TaxID=1265738 RepID=M5RQS8_9BACT|nr:response regulator [Rhodopirellula maiorica]EMI16289.1 two-component system response regulator [Rhodopirellula maiorica SM1]
MSKQTRVLIVEDDEAIRFGTQLRLETRDFAVSTAIDGCDGLQQIRADQPDVILMDIRMPNMDGLTALAELKADPTTSEIPVIIASASLGDKTTALDIGAKYFLCKPYSNDALFAVVDSSL